MYLLVMVSGVPKLALCMFIVEKVGNVHLEGCGAILSDLMCVYFFILNVQKYVDLGQILTMVEESVFA